jgi:hypothetical protein
MYLCEACKDCDVAKYDSISRCSDLCSIPWDYLKAIEQYNKYEISQGELIDKINHIAATYFI